VLEDQLQVLLPKLIGTSGNYELIVFGIVLVLVLKYLPDGLWDRWAARHLPAAPRRQDWADAATAARAQQARHRVNVVLDVQAMRKQFGGLVAVNDISFKSAPARSPA
jgi:branched-chain amino acid transport system permease protein